jgi:hypothetical protein
MADLIPWPFPLPERFVDQLGYPRVVEAFDSPAMRAPLAELLRRQGIAEPQPMPTGRRRFVALHWEPAGDELAFTDGVHSGAGQSRTDPERRRRARGDRHPATNTPLVDPPLRLARGVLGKLIAALERAPAAAGH